MLTGLLVVMDGLVDLHVRNIAQRHGLSVLCPPSVERALRDIVRLCPAVLIVLLAGAHDEALRIVHLAAGAAPDGVLIASARAHGEGIERAARRAGAAYYVPELGSQLGERVLESVLAPRHRSPAWQT